MKNVSTKKLKRFLLKLIERINETNIRIKKNGKKVYNEGY